MLFNSYEFLFFFLPITLVVYFALGRRGYVETAMAWLILMSLFFYAWWKPAYLIIIVASILINYLVGFVLGRWHANTERSPAAARMLLFLGIAFNLGLLGYFKYAGFFVENLNGLLGSSLGVREIALPLAISFFTFQQIAYLVDAYRGAAREYNFLHYGLFVTFFPQLIAGPIVHHKEILPQFQNRESFRLNFENVAVGITIFVVGLFKKVILADGIAVYASPVFKAGEQGQLLTFGEAWGGALAYTFQLYFDFSGYSDMAIGIAAMVGIVLPLNFNAPYKSLNIISFWQKWHMTLSRFFRDYLYIPLGGNRKGELRKYLNILLTMTLCGLWHGAGWTFVLWGILHGVFVVLNHSWRYLRRMLGHDLGHPALVTSLISWLITFVAVVFAWVLFRAESLSGAGVVIRGMLGCNGMGSFSELLSRDQLYFTLLLAAVAFILPTIHDLMGRYQVLKRPSRLSWKPSWMWGLITASMAIVSIINLSDVSEFLYFNF